MLHDIIGMIGRPADPESSEQRFLVDRSSAEQFLVMLIEVLPGAFDKVVLVAVRGSCRHYDLLSVLGHLSCQLSVDVACSFGAYIYPLPCFAVNPLQ